jgi:hypothetical protein
MNTVRLAGGRLYIDHELYATYFANRNAVILLLREQRLHILPVQSAANGGYLLKQRNAKGDRVVDAPDLFSPDVPEARYEVAWNPQAGGLVTVAGTPFQIT